MRYLITVLFFFPLFCFSQKKINTLYKNAFYVEFPLVKSVSANYSRLINVTNKGFTTVNMGAAYILGYTDFDGQSNPLRFRNSGLGIPISVSYNRSLGTIDKKTLESLTNRCVYGANKFKVDWFLEFTGGVKPTFYKRKERNDYVAFSFVGLRGQTKISRPKKENDLIVFLRFGGVPDYQIKHKSFDFSFALSTGIGL